MKLECNHVWEFHTLGVDGDAMRGRGPQRAVFVCCICKERIRQQTIPGTCLPDLSVPPYWVGREGTPQWEST